MTLKEYKDKLNTLHARIKKNPFRSGYEANMRYGKEYFDTVYKFAETFYHLVKDIKSNNLEDITAEDKKLSKMTNVHLFIHDFYGSINRSSNALFAFKTSNDYLRKKNPLDILHGEEEYIELCISCIHGYLDIGLFNRYPIKCKNSIIWKEWNDEKQDYITKSESIV